MIHFLKYTSSSLQWVEQEGIQKEGFGVLCSREPVTCKCIWLQCSALESPSPCFFLFQCSAEEMFIWGMGVNPGPRASFYHALHYQNLYLFRSLVGSRENNICLISLVIILLWGKKKTIWKGHFSPEMNLSESSSEPLYLLIMSTRDTWGKIVKEESG